MASLIPQAMTRTVVQALNTLSGNGTAVDQKAQHDLFYVGPSAGTAGIYTFERSVDGLNWETQLVTRLSDGSTISATAAGETDDCYLVRSLDGVAKLRARISTNWVTNAPSVTHVAVN
jgi:hypothetical protein